MKKLLSFFVCCLFAFVQLSAQNQLVEVLLIGASHNYGNMEPQDLSGIHSKIQKFKPDAFFGEWLSPEDEKNLVSYWNKDNVIARTKRLYGKRPIEDDQLPATISSLRQQLAQNPKDFKTRVDLAHACYLSLDAANGHFQMWQVSKELKRDPGNTALFEYAKLVLHPSLDSIQKAINNYANSEYDLIAYPVMLTLGHDRIWPMDSQEFDPFWSEAWAYSDSLANLFDRQMKENPNSPEALHYRAIRAKEEQMGKTMKEGKAGYDSKHYTELLNSPFVDDFYFRMNIVSTDLLALRGFPAAAFQEKLHWWMMRNIRMCENTINRARANGLKKVVVVVGAGHRYPMATLFSQMEGVKVWNVNEY